MHFDLARRLDDDELAEVEQAVRAALVGGARGRLRLQGDDRARRRHDHRRARRHAPVTRATRCTRSPTSSSGCCTATSSCSARASTSFSDGAISVVDDSGLGILRDEDRSAYCEPVPLAELPPAVRERATNGDLLLVTKTNAISPVHRHERMDYVGVRLRLAQRRDRRRVAPARPVHLEGVRRARVGDAAAAPQAAPGARRRGPDRGLARLQGGGRAVRLVPEGGAVRRAGRRPAARRGRADRPRGLGPSPAARPPRRRRPQRVAHPRAPALALQPVAGLARERAAAPPLRDRRGRGAPRARRGSARAAALPRALRRRAARDRAARPRGRA